MVHEPANTDAIHAADVALGGPLPADLAGFLAESDGLSRDHDRRLVWPLGHIVETNLAFRTSEDFAALYMPFDALLFFADASNGNQFAFRWQADLIDVFVWDHENDSQTWIASNLGQYLEWRLDGTITA